MTETVAFEHWAILELMGHRRLAGKVSETTIAGKGFLRIDIPISEEKVTTQMYNPDAIYGIIPTTEEIARSVAEYNQESPVHPYELPALPEIPKQENNNQGKPEERKCERCGCTESNPCIDENGIACHWVGANLCSACLTGEEDFDLEKVM